MNKQFPQIKQESWLIEHWPKATIFLAIYSFTHAFALRDELNKAFGSV
jgi:hypothetical protein